MLRTVAYSQLDPDTKTYLRVVRQSRGRGMPGVFDTASDSRAGVAFLVGLVVLVLFLWIGYSTNKAPWAMALIQTAGVVLGGWLIVYAFRRWTAKADRYAGKFTYFDPAHVFVGQGEELSYARLDEETEAQPAGETAVSFRTDSGKFTVPVTSRSVANYVADYYDALSHLREKAGDNWWNRASDAELGAIARFMVVNERVPVGMDEVSSSAVPELPDEVRPARGKPSGILRYLLILLVGGAVYAGFAFTNKPLHDAAAFAGVDQTNPADLRHYIADPNTEAHHDEASKKLKELYVTKRTQLAARANTDAEVRDAFLTLFDTLDGPEPPAVSILVADTSGNATSTSWAKTLRTRLADGIGTEAGKEYILFVEPPNEPGRWPLVELTYASQPNGQLSWTLAFRTKPTDETPYASLTRTVGEANVIPSEAVYADVMKKMLGNAPAAPPPLNDW